MNQDPSAPGFLRRLLSSFDQKTPKGIVRGLMLFFLTVYIYEGVVDPDGLQKQTLAYYLAKGLGWPTDKAAQYVLILALPWVLKPLYGLVSDFVPIFGYRRKSYLILANLATSAACFWLATLAEPAQIIMPLFVISLGTAASSALCQAVMVEGGKLTGLTGKFVSQQWLWFAVAGMVVLPLGGFLSDKFGPLAGLHAAALIMGFPPLLVIAATLFFIKEERVAFSKEQFKSALHGLVTAFASRTLWLVASFIALWYFSPAFGMSIYYFQTQELGFSQEFIGMLGMIGMAGAIAGSVLYMFYLRNERTARAAIIMCRYTGLTFITNVLGNFLAALFGMLSSPVRWVFKLLGLEAVQTAYHLRHLRRHKQRQESLAGINSLEASLREGELARQHQEALDRGPRNLGVWLGESVKPFFEQYAHEMEQMTIMKGLIYLSLIFGVITQGSYVFLGGHVSAIVLSALTSIPSQVALLTMLTLAARACPDKAEGFTYAAIMSVYNFSIQFSSNVGASLYEHVFNHHLTPLVWISAAATSVCFFLVPFLPKASLAAEDKDGSK